MPVYKLIVLGCFVLAGMAIVTTVAHKRRLKSRNVTIDLYKTRSDLSIKQKIFEICQSVFTSIQSSSKKSPVLVAAEQFKKDFHLGRFVIFCSERNLLLPLMGVGFKLKTIKSIRASLVEDGNPFPSGDSYHKPTDNAIVLGEAKLKTIVRAADIPQDLSDHFIFKYRFNRQQVLFVGEDPRRELSRYCLDDDFNRAIWPMIFEICHSNHNIKKRQQKIKGIEEELRRARTELTGLSRKLRNKIVDLHSFFDISNKMFTIYDEQRLIDAYVESITSMLSPARIAILKRAGKIGDRFRVVTTGGKIGPKTKSLELSADSQVLELLTVQKRALILPVLSSGMQGNDLFVDRALAEGFSHAEKLHAAENVYAVVLIGDKSGDEGYSDDEMEVFSTLSNMASLALRNIHQYELVEKMSYTDSMTQLYNYRYFYKRLSEEIIRAKRFDRMLVLVIFDIDNFKTFNDAYGHQAGDEILKSMAALVTGSVRAIDIVSRYGGEEFCVIMPDTGFANCLIFIERLRKRIEGYGFKSKYVEKDYKITVSIGAAVYPTDAKTADRLIYCADMALLKAKADGRNRSIMFNSKLLEDEELKKSSQAQLTDLGIYEDI